MLPNTLGYPDEINSNVSYEFRDSLIRRIFGKCGWYIVSPKATQGPFSTKKDAEDVFFFDRNYK